MMFRSTQLRALLAVLVVALGAAPVLAATARPRKKPPAPAQESVRVAHEAAIALFEKSDLESARVRSGAALKENAANLEAIFVEMEAAALQGDTGAALEAALRLCELRDSDDARVNIAAARILDLAANTPEFRAAVPRIRALVEAGRPQVNYMRAALVAAAADGVPGLSVLHLARESGLITDWRMAGPFGRYRNVAFEQEWTSQRDGLSQAHYDTRPVEEFRFDDGNVTLPDYFARSGVFYAASDVTLPATGEWRIRVESGGTMEVFVDGAGVLKKDGRFRATPEIVAAVARLSAGTHRVLVKFLPSAAPFRVAVLPLRETQATRTERPPVSIAAESDYVRAASAYWTGDYDAAMARLRESRRQQPSAALDFLLALAWAHAAPDSPEERSLLESVLLTAPSALAAEQRLAEALYADGRVEEALTRVRRVLAARPNLVPARELMAEIAMRLNWQAEAAQALEARARLHPFCGALREGAKYLSGIGAYAQAENMEAQLRACAPGSLDYAEALGDSGRHAEAAQAAAAVLRVRPLDRNARALQVRELALAGQAEAAKNAAAELTRLAPNAERFQRLAEQVATRTAAFDELGSESRDFAGDGFFARYRREAFHMVKSTAQRRFSGGPAVNLLHDRVVRVQQDGSLALYVHKITRVLNREGIVQYGEVSIPKNAEVLELRTIKADGSLAEPEFNQHKATISMPGLAPGDVIDLEYVVRYESGAAEGAEAAQYVFGSFAAPILFSRFVVIVPAAQSASLQIVTIGAAPRMETHKEGDLVARVWATDDIPQSAEETSMPKRDNLPSVRVLPGRAAGWADVRDYYRDMIIEAARIGTRVEEAARAITGGSDEDKARAAYAFVASKVRAADAAFDGGLPTAEETLASRAGSRTATLLAMAHALGLDAELLLARDVGVARPPAVTPLAYTRPLVRFRLSSNGAQKQIVVDAETDGLSFGAVPPTVERSDALLVPVWSQALEQATIVSLPGSVVSDDSVAEGDITFDLEGTLSARLTIRMGAWRGAQMRSILAGIEPGGRKRFFEQLALRIFPGAADANGEVHNEHDPDRALELLVNCQAPHFLNFSGALADMEQLVPALGLRKLYVGPGGRKFSLYIDTPLFETATFRVHLPQGVRITSSIGDLDLRSEFGDYSVRVRQLSMNQVEIRRAFRIPVQVVSPERFAAFKTFALRIDEVERQRFTLERDGRAAAQAAGTASDRVSAR